MKEEGSVSWDGPRQLLPSGADSGLFTWLASSCTSCFLHFQIISEEGRLVYQSPHHSGGGGYRLGVGNSLSAGTDCCIDARGYPREAGGGGREVSTRLQTGDLPAGLGRQVWTAPPRPR